MDYYESNMKLHPFLFLGVTYLFTTSLAFLNKRNFIAIMHPLITFIAYDYRYL